MSLDSVWSIRIDANATPSQHIELIEEHQYFGVWLVDGGDDGEVVRMCQFSQT